MRRPLHVIDDSKLTVNELMALWQEGYEVRFPAEEILDDARVLVAHGVKPSEVSRVMAKEIGIPAEQLRP